MRQVSSKLVKCRGCASSLPDMRMCPYREVDRELSCSKKVGAEVSQYLTSYTLLFPHKAKEDMFAPDIIVTEETCFFNSKFKYLFGPWGERYITKGHKICPLGQVSLSLP